MNGTKTARVMIFAVAMTVLGASGALAQSPLLTVTSPNGGELWIQGETQFITWDATDVSGALAFWLEANGEPSDWIGVADASDGYLFWTVPTSVAPGSAYKLHAMSGDDNSIEDLSDDAFTIQAAGGSDTTPPVITLVGEADTAVECGGYFEDSGATAMDDVDGDLTGYIMVGGDPVDTTVVGTYTVTYNVQDFSGNNAIEVARTVRVVDTLMPVISLNSWWGTDYAECGDAYVASGATAWDDCAGDLTGRIVVSGDTVNLAAPGAYTVTYGVSDGTNIALPVPLTVIVQDTTPPEITLNGGATVTVPRGGTYIELGATVTDNCAAGLGVTIGGDTVSTAMAGTYIVTYDANDGNGNSAEVTRTVIVTEGPSITVTSPNGGDLWLQGETETITWDQTLVTGLVGVLLNENGTDTMWVGAVAASDGQMTWEVRTSAAPGSDYKVHIVSADNSAIEDLSDATFTIMAPPLTLTSPNGGEIWVQDHTYAVTWNATDLTGYVAVLLYENGTDVWWIDAALASVGQVLWTVPGGLTPGTDYSVRIIYGDDNRFQDLSDEPFTVAAGVADTTPPVIKLVGETATTAECGFDYTDEGATAIDDVDGDLTGNIVVGGDTVNTAVVGTYTVTYNVQDASGNSAVEVTRTVRVVDIVPPDVSPNYGWETQIVECGQTYTDLGAAAYDICVGDVTGSIVVGGDTVNPAAVGTYSVTYSASDGMNTCEPATRTVIVEDTTPPVITLNGGTTVTVPRGGTYTEPGATVTDNCAAGVTVSIGGDTVNTSVADTYTVTYNANDGNGNSAEVTRTVIVAEAQSLAVTSPNGGELWIQGETQLITWDETGVTGSVACWLELDGAITKWIGMVPASDGELSYVLPMSVAPGSAYKVHIMSGDNNAIEDLSDDFFAIEAPSAVDTTPPVITLVGEAAATVQCGYYYEDAGATAMDDVDGDLTGYIVVGGDPVNTALVGTYTVTYNVQDFSGNSAVEATRTVRVVDTTAPVISLNAWWGTDYAECGGPYVASGATAWDDCVGDVTGSIEVAGDTVDPAAVGTYFITYGVGDGTNIAAPVTLTVIVQDTTAPVISLLGDATVTVQRGGTYTEPGATVTDDCAAGLTVSIGGDTVNTAVTGTYTVTYDANDANGNSAIQVARSVDVVTGQPVINDLFADAIELTGSMGQATGSNCGASSEPGEPCLTYGCYTRQRSVWWTWVAPATGMAFFDTHGSGFNTALGAYTGDSVDALTEVTTNDDDGSPNGASGVSFAAQAGTRYYLLVDGYYDWSAPEGSIVLNWNTAPANDNFAEAFVFEGASGEAAGTNAWATLEPGEPNYGGNSVWWQWTAPSDGDVVFNVATGSGGSGGFPATLYVYTGASVDDLSAVGSNSTVFHCVGGTQYHVQVDGGGASGPVDVTWSFTEAPANDLFANAAELTGASGQVTGTNAGAWWEDGEPWLSYCCYWQRSVWWTWEAPETGMVSFDTHGSDFNTALGIYTGDTVDALAYVTHNDDDGGPNGTSGISFLAQAGTRYHILVDGYYYWEPVGSITLNWAYTELSTIASFEAHPTSGPPPLTVTFTDTSTQGSSPITGWSWNFGDGQTATEQNPQHDYAQTGDYTVTMQVATGTGFGSLSAPPVTIHVSGTPTVLRYDFPYGSTEGGGLVEFVGTGFNFSSGVWQVTFDGVEADNPYSTGYYYWGNYLISYAPPHAAGVVDVVITTPRGDVATLPQSYIYGDAPVAACSATPTADPLTFTCTDESASGTYPVVSKTWDFGDGQSLTETGWEYCPFTGHYYKLTDPGLTWHEAKQQAEDMGGYLTAVNDVRENTWLFWALSYGYSPLWIGLTDEAEQGTWAWANGETSDYRFWAPGQPDNTNRFGVLSWSGQGDWANIGNNGNDRVPGIVERDTPPDFTFQIPVHAYAGPGTYTVTLITRNFLGQSAATTQAVTEGMPSPTVSSVSPTILSPEGGGWVWISGANFWANTPGTRVLFDGVDADSVTIYNYDALYCMAPPHVPAVVDVTVINPDGQSDTLAGGFAYEVPTNASFDASPASGPAPLAVTFTDTSTPGTSPVTAWSWSFGDGQTSDGQNPQHTYAVPGDYTVNMQLTTVSGYGSLSAAPVSIHVFGGPTVLRYDYPFGPTAGGGLAEFVGTGFDFSGAWHVAFDGIEAENPYIAGWYYWNDNYLVSYAPPHAAGVVDVVITNPGGDTTTLPRSYIYGDAPVAACSATPATDPLSFTCTDMSDSGTYPISRKTWDFGDGQSLTETGWEYCPLTGHYYKLTDNSLSWHEAKQQAEDLGGYLATVNDVRENSWLFWVFSYGYGPLWIGLTDEAEQGTWIWANGETSDYRFWAPGQPDNTNQFGVLSWYGQGDWANIGNNDERVPGIIERDTPPDFTFQNPVHAYAWPGTYTVTLTTRNFLGQSTATREVFTNNAPSPTVTSLSPAILPTKGGQVWISGTDFWPNTPGIPHWGLPRRKSTKGERKSSFQMVP